MNKSQPPLIAHVIFRLAVGGLENGLVNLINGLPQESFRHVIICIDDFTDFKSRIQRDDVDVIAIHKKPGTDLSALWRLYSEFRRLKPHIVHTRNLGALDALLPAFLAAVPCRIHSEHGWDVSDLYGRNRKHQVLRRVHSPLVHRYIALSIHLQDYLVDRVKIRPERIVQLYNGVSTERFRPAPLTNHGDSFARDKFGKDAVLIGNVGRMQPVKDPLNLVNGFVLLIEQNPELAESARLVMIGDGSLRHAVLARLEEAGLGELAWIPGERNDIPELLQSFDVYVQPSLAEGISNTILEAMASGLPVIATDVGGNSELVADGETGIIVAPADIATMTGAMSRYIQEPQLRSSHGVLGRKRAVDTFAMGLMLSGYYNLYREMTDGKYGPQQ